MRQHKNLKGHDYHGTCGKTGKRQYSSRSHARKARQAYSHTHGTPYKCVWCGYWHLGHYRKKATRAAYRGEEHAASIHVNAAAEALDIGRDILLAALDALRIPVTDDHIPEEILPRIQALTYRQS